VQAELDYCLNKSKLFYKVTWKYLSLATHPLMCSVEFDTSTVRNISGWRHS